MLYKAAKSVPVESRDEFVVEILSALKMREQVPGHVLGYYQSLTKWGPAERFGSNYQLVRASGIRAATHTAMVTVITTLWSPFFGN